MTCDVGPWETGGASFISIDGQLASGCGIREGTPSVLEGSEELYGGLVKATRDMFGDADRLGVVSQSIRWEVVSRSRTCEADTGFTTSPSSI